jgi:hypothetical protein
MGADELKKVLSKVEFVSPHLVVIASYRFVFGGASHHTGHVFTLQRRNIPRPITIEKNRWPAAIFVDEGDIQQVDLVMMRSPIGGDYAD